MPGTGIRLCPKCLWRELPLARVSVTVDGVRYDDDVEPRLLLVHYLRDRLGRTGTPIGCDTSNCGACTVHVDGNAVRSCQVAIGGLEGSLVTTIEALSPDRSHPVQQAFAHLNVSQCGFCIPGMIMAAAALIERNAAPTDADIDAAMTNFCRCGIYPRLRPAIRLAARIRSGAETVAGAPPPGISAADAVRSVPALRDVGQPRRR